MNDFTAQPTFVSKDPHHLMNAEDMTRVKKSAIENRDVLCEAYDYPNPA